MRASGTNGHIAAIDGLRAIAVLAIIVFHIDAQWLPGGFVGVDVFFVISGFVVAYSVGQAGGKSLPEYFLWFYRRRLIRIYPVLLVFLVVTLAVGSLFIPIAETSKFIELTGAAAAFGVSNILLMLKTGDYFATASEYNLFTHTWSLGVEEQYYILFPIFSYFILIRPAKSRWWVCAVIGAALASLAACAVLSFARPEWAFYLLPTRFWELAAGFLLYLLCFGENRVPRTLPAWIGGQTAGWLGAIGLLVSIVLADAKAFPFPWAVLPVFATSCLILMAIVNPQHPLSRLFSIPVLRWIGTISYSLYLWHWAVIVAMKWTIGVDTIALKALAATMILVLSIASYYLIEDMARRAVWIKRLPTPQFYGGAIVALGLVASFGVGAYFYKPAMSLSQTALVSVWDPMQRYEGGQCGLERQVQNLVGGLVLTFAPSACPEMSQRVFVMGDSHAGAYNRVFERLAADEGYRVVNYTMGGCKLIDAFDPLIINGCAEFRRLALEAIADTATAGDTVFFAGHFTRRYRDAWHPTMLETSAIEVPAESKLFAEQNEVENLIAPLLAKDVNIVFEGPKPISITALFRCADWFTEHNTYCAAGDRALRSDLLQRTSAVASFQSAIASRTGITQWQPFDILCPLDQTTCPTYQDGKPLYYDTDHLSAYGNDVLLPAFKNLLLQ